MRGSGSLSAWSRLASNAPVSRASPEEETIAGSAAERSGLAHTIAHVLRLTRHASRPRGSSAYFGCKIRPTPGRAALTGERDFSESGFGRGLLKWLGYWAYWCSFASHFNSLPYSVSFITPIALRWARNSLLSNTTNPVSWELVSGQRHTDRSKSEFMQKHQLWQWLARRNRDTSTMVKQRVERLLRQLVSRYQGTVL